MLNLLDLRWVPCFVALAAGVTLQVPLDIIPVVGHWSVSIEGEATVVTSDPRQWDGASGPDLDAIARALFEQPSRAFAANAAPATAFPLAIVKGVTVPDRGALQVQFKLIAGPSDQTAGIAFGIGPAADYVFARYNTKDGNVAVWEFVDGKRRVLAHGTEHAQLPLNAWHTLSVELSAGRVVAKVAGTRLSVTHDMARPLRGRIGFWTKRDATSAFKAFQVSK